MSYKIYTILLGFFFLSGSILFGAENQGRQSINSSDGWKNPVTIQIPSFSDMSAFLSNGATSLFATAATTFSDDEAFTRLGWPPTHAQAGHYLKRSLAHYEKFRMLTPTHVDWQEYSAFVERRENYIKRAYKAFAYRPDGLEFAIHCLEHHHPVMNDLFKQLFITFIQEKGELSAAARTILAKHQKSILDKEQK